VRTLKDAKHNLLPRMKTLLSFGTMYKLALLFQKQARALMTSLRSNSNLYHIPAFGGMKQCKTQAFVMAF
jgi:hypothetical protein